MGSAFVESPVGAGPAVQLEAVTRRFPNKEVLSAITLSIQEGEFFSILGPSGCGKTTLLRLIAGLDQPTSGTIRLHGRDITPLPAHLRPVNTVFQSYALFPHLTVYDNVAFGLRMKRVPNQEIAERVEKVMALASIQELRDRKPAKLSGGEKQRVALPRAVVNEPEVHLLDEPLSALDAQLRDQLGNDLRRLQQRLGLTCMYVTHDQGEALRLSDRLAIMRHGRMEQVDTPEAIYATPRTRFAAEFLGACNLIEAELLRIEPSGLRLSSALGELLVKGESPASPGTRRILAIRPEKIRLREAGNGGPTATVIARTFAGASVELLLETSNRQIRARCENGLPERFGKVGETVGLDIRPEDLVLLEDE